MHTVINLILGALAGFIAGKIMGSRTSAFRNVVLGIVGSAVGNALFGLIGFYSFNWIGDVIISVVGACICIWVGRKVFD